jgi:hypothetical protein
VRAGRCRPSATPGYEAPPPHKSGTGQLRPGCTHAELQYPSTGKILLDYRQFSTTLDIQFKELWMREEEERINQSFNPDEKNEREKLSKYLDLIHKCYVETIHQMRRLVLALLALMAAFEVINSSNLNVISIGGLTVARDSLVLVYVPPVVTYLFFQACLCTVKLGSLDSHFAAAFKLWNSKAYENNLASTILPQGEAFWYTTAQPTSLINSRFVHGVLIILNLGIIAIVPIFEIHAYLSFFHHHTGNAVLIWISMLFSVLIFIAALHSLATSQSRQTR